MCEICYVHKDMAEGVRLTPGFEEWARFAQTEDKQGKHSYKVGGEKSKPKVRRWEALGGERFRVAGVGETVSSSGRKHPCYDLLVQQISTDACFVEVFPQRETGK